MNRYYKSLFALLLAVTVAFSFVGCTSGGQYEKNDAHQLPQQEYGEEYTDENADEYEITYGESYTAPEAVAAYLYAWEELPPNFITKNKAEKLGWQSNKGNLWEVAEGMSIGGDKFGNREGILPQGENYRECDVNYAGGYREAERLVYSTDDFDIYYTSDHYESYEQIYDAEDGYVWDMDIILE
ncbi:MAG: ribonuclease [Ruminococcaceae bacterium]|nr:ribonuclease [Oscillospiraceae bacterium]